MTTVSEIAMLCWLLTVNTPEGVRETYLGQCRPAPEIRQDRVIADQGNVFRMEKGR